jgi:glycosyltransferase involved in cell wall biosynthesis
LKKILVVGMVDSVHLARWLGQFESEDVQITLFPSTRFKRLHPAIESMVLEKKITFYPLRFTKLLAIRGYLDFAQFEIFTGRRRQFSRSNVLKNILRQTKFDLLHLIELQHAGYLYLETGIKSNRSFRVILTNYGSDLVYFMDSPIDRDKLERLMGLADFYSAECRRDYHLAKELGFIGTELPLMPNAGGIDDETLQMEILPLNKRNTVYIKGYGGKFGLGAISLKVAGRILDIYPNIEVVVVSLTSDLKEAASELQDQHKNRIHIHGIGDGISREQVLSILRKSIICIGASQSDGISTTFLEALVSGAVPIQTNTSCASEWVERGFFAKIVSPNEADIYESATEILNNISAYQGHTERNIELSKEELSYGKLAEIAHTFYRLESAGDK